MVNYNAYNQAKDIQTVSDIIGSWSFYQFTVFLFQFIHAFLLPLFNHQFTEFYDIDTSYECLQSGNNFTIESYFNELNFSHFKCNLKSSECDEFKFNCKNYETSLIKSLNLTCEKEFLKYFLSSIYQLGCLVSILFYFILCKRFGRACLIKSFMAIELISNLSSSFIFNYYCFLISRFFLGIGSFGVFLLSFILLMEIVGTQVRSNVVVLVQLGWTLGQIIFPLIMKFFINNYIHLERIIIIIQFLLLIYSFCIAESPKWELLNGHYKKAEQTLIKTGKGFYKLSTHEIKNRLMLLREHLIEQEVNQKFNFTNKNGHRIDFQLIFKALSLIFSWFICKLIYFTISYYPELFTKNNGDYLEQNIFYQNLVELFAFLLTYLLIRFISKRIYILVCALFFVVISIFGFMLIIKFAVSLIIQILLLFTGECFDDNLHPKIYGYSMAFGCLGALLASFIPLFIDYYNLTITLILLGTLAIIDLFLVIWLPDTVYASPYNSTQKLSSDLKTKSDLTMEDANVEFSFKIEE